MPTCPTCGAAITAPIAAEMLPKVRSTLIARAVLLGVQAHPVDDDHGRPCMVFTRGHWTEMLALREAAHLLDVLDIIQGRAA